MTGRLLIHLIGEESPNMDLGLSYMTTFDRLRRAKFLAHASEAVIARHAGPPVGVERVMKMAAFMLGETTAAGTA